MEGKFINIKDIKIANQNLRIKLLGISQIIDGDYLKLFTHVWLIKILTLEMLMV